MVAKPTYSKADAVEKLRRADELLAQGVPMTHVCRQLSISELTYYRWKNRYATSTGHHGGSLDEVRAENERLRAIVAQQTLDLFVLLQGADREARRA